MPGRHLMRREGLNGGGQEGPVGSAPPGLLSPPLRRWASGPCCPTGWDVASVGGRSRRRASGSGLCSRRRRPFLESAAPPAASSLGARQHVQELVIDEEELSSDLDVAEQTRRHQGVEPY